MLAAKKIRPFLILLTVVVVAIVGPALLVLYAQKAKRQHKFWSDMAYINTVGASLNDVQAQTRRDADAQKAQNKAAMEAAYITYRRLLSEQPGILEKQKTLAVQPQAGSGSVVQSAAQPVARPKVSRPTKQS
jgi:hypothetical protein